VPTKAAWEAGKGRWTSCWPPHRAKTGRVPAKLTFTLWSVETMRHFGLLEAQALWALGVQPVWDDGGRVSGVKLIPREQLGRPRVDVVLSATGLYRDHFPNVMKQLAEAAKLASRSPRRGRQPGGGQRGAHRAQPGRLGVPQAEARSQAPRASSPANRAATAPGWTTPRWPPTAGRPRPKATASWPSCTSRRMQYAYGPDEAGWGRAGVSTARRLNLYAEHLRGTEAAVLSRSSNLYGMLTTDDPFQYLGGIGLAVRHLDGKAPELYVSNLRGSGGGRVEGAAQFLAKELATRNFHPGHIQGLMAEGYAGTLQVLDGINNFAGWQSVAREIVRHDQWQEFMDVYVRDKHQLGLKPTGSSSTTRTRWRRASSACSKPRGSGSGRPTRAAWPS
jgi:cobaltochelatase CobN